MMRMKLRRQRSKGHKARRAVLAVGALGAATEGVRRFRHRHTTEQTED
jgi:hypothetical protein